MSVLSLADAKAYLRLTGDTYDAELQATIDSAEATIARRVGPLAVAEVEERIPTDGCEFVLSRGPYVSLTTVLGVYPLETVDPDDLHVDSESLVVSYADGYTSFLSDAYDVTYQAGYDDLPVDLMNGIKELVRHRWRPQRGGVNMPGTAADEDPVEYYDGLPASVHNLICDYIVDDSLGFA